MYADQAQARQQSGLETLPDHNGMPTAIDYRTEPSEPIRVGIAAGGAALRAGLLSLLAGLEELEVVSVAAVPEGLTFDLPPDVLVWAYPTSATEVAFPESLQAGVSLLMLVPLSGRLPPASSLPRNSAWGLLSVEASPEELHQAILALAEGLSVLAPQYLRALINQNPEPAQGVEPLSHREIEVLEQLALGQTNKQIAALLRISEHTVKFHISTIYGKLGVLNRAEAVQVGIRQGYITF